LPTLKS